ncbi:probably inactive leucine-rich repeat receptor-like protein kinase At2g25790 isoform X2 [Tripterygium wilfordii]|uniref:probably inactive leucine-rich repeat receptor-like protein kinase At2g25790 isoform X2 n=1 Tax=Tripterygium wilfordii TaxID=458696 RepID=UPI0018F7FD6F|nr:probably inactive leucine-rich repeat receptor-like protein kinase At2g25790 isoform X2 [Tripterygium wilfordii]
MKGIQESSSLLTFIMFLLFFTMIGFLHGEELGTLSSFKASINDPLNHLSNWNSNNNLCDWHGITCDSMSHVHAIELSSKNISGKLSSSSTFHLPFISRIDLSNNRFSGEIPHDMFFNSSFQYLNLSNNNFTGQIPSGRSISKLETLDLSNNMLSGRIPDTIGSFSSLRYLDLGGNVLVGEIPISITNLKSLEYLTLASNHLVGPIPPQLGQMKSLKWIYFGYNNLSGKIPTEIGFLTSLNHLDLVYNNFAGQIPSSIGNLSDLQYLFLYQNKLTGSIPKSVFSLKRLISLDLSDNFLSGEIPELIIQLENLEILHLFSNNFIGKIPTALTSLPNLRVLQLWSNKLSGEIPAELGKHNNLSVLDLSTNSLAGKIPESLCGSGHLFKLILFSNSLEGEIPKSLSDCKSLQRVRLQDNKLSGGLPQGLTQLPLVYFLDISGNNLSGRIDDREWNMPSLQMLNLAKNQFVGDLPSSFAGDKLETLDLSRNRFSGTIPSQFRSLSSLVQLDLSENKLSGEIPEEMSSCKKLVSVDLSHNQLGGSIPASLAQMPVLSELDLSDNHLSGEIPRNLGRVESLVQVNISHNNFHGTLPSTGAFLAIHKSAIEGNDLCGGDTTTGLRPCKKSTNKNPIWGFIVACFIGALMLLAIVAFAIVFIKQQNSLSMKRVENEEGIWEMQIFRAKAITIEDILSSMKEENVISRSKTGVSYKGKCVSSGMQIMVKLINDVNSLPPNSWAQIAQFGKLQHHNIVKLVGICRSKKRAYLVYEHVEGKKLSEILGNLSWERRKKISIGIVKALRFLHSHCSSSILTGDISTDQVIVDDKDVPRLELSTNCFISPAYASPDASEIYGFGLILIELLTGRSCRDTGYYGSHESIVEWARYCDSDCHPDTWIDPVIRVHASNDHNEIVEIMTLALHCTATDPTARPTADEVLKTLESALRTSSWLPHLKFSSCVH